MTPRRKGACPGASQSGIVSSPLAARGDVPGAVLEPVLHARRVGPRVVVHTRHQEVAQPAHRPHPTADADALGQQRAGHARGVEPDGVVVGRGDRARPGGGHRSHVGAQREQHRARLEQPGPEGLHRLVVRRGDHRQPGAQPERGGSLAGEVTEHLTRLDEVGQQGRVHAGARVLGGIGRPPTRDRVEGPQPGVRRRAVAPLAGQAHGQIPPGAGDGAHARVDVGQRTVDARVHPAHHRLGEPSVDVDERPGRSGCRRARRPRSRRPGCRRGRRRPPGPRSTRRAASPTGRRRGARPAPPSPSS